MGTGSDHRAHPCRTGSRAVHASSYAKKKEADARRRDKAQAEYVEDFFGAVVAFLAFHPNYADLAQRWHGP